jgi:hypothetical protein
MRLKLSLALRLNWHVIEARSNPLVAKSLHAPR